MPWWWEKLAARGMPGYWVVGGNLDAATWDWSAVPLDWLLLATQVGHFLTNRAINSLGTLQSAVSTLQMRMKKGAICTYQDQDCRTLEDVLSRPPW